MTIKQWGEFKRFCLANPHITDLQEQVDLFYAVTFYAITRRTEGTIT